MDPHTMVHQVTGLPALRELQLGDEHACGIAASDNAVWCWGSNLCFQSGGPTFDPNMPPAIVEGARDAVQLALGAEHSCLRDSQGAVFCWGRYSSQVLCATDDPSMRAPRAPARVVF
jgi:alpha-tubulin suppressor-like RCC1 family protein